MRQSPCASLTIFLERKRSGYSRSSAAGRGCEEGHEAIAVRLFDDLSPKEEAGLLAHLEGCADSQAVASEFALTYRMLSYVDPAAGAPTGAVPAQLTERVLRELHNG